MVKTYVRFFYPGSFVSETSDELVSDRSHPEVPNGAYGYRFYDQTEEASGDETLFGKPKNWSPTYYFGEEFSADEIKKCSWANSILISNVEGNGYKRIVKTKRGNVFPLEDGDVVLK